MPVATVMEVQPVTPEAGVRVPEAQVTMHVNVPAMKVDPVVTMDPVRQMDAVHAVTADVANAAAADMATTAATNMVASTTATAMRTRISTSGSESCNADNGRRDESEESRTFEHCRRPFWLGVGHPKHWSRRRGLRFNRLIY